MHIPYSKLKHKELLKRIPNLHEQVIVVVIKNDRKNTGKDRKKP